MAHVLVELMALLLLTHTSAAATTFGLSPQGGGEAQAPPQSPAEFVLSCHPHLRRHCADAEATSHTQCRSLLPADPSCTDDLIARFRAENCAQYVPDGGLIDIQRFGGAGDGLTDNAAAIRRAVNATRACGGSIKFPTGRYYVSETIQLARDSEWGGYASFVGVGMPIFKGDQRFSFVAYNTGPTALLFSKQPTGPVIRIGEHNVSGGANDGGGLGCGGNVYFENIGLSGLESGLHIINSAWVRLRNVGVKASVHTGGDSNAAMVVENSFWQWFEEGSSFEFRCDGQSDCHGLPSVILRGNNETEAFVRTVYALRFDRVTMSGGGIMYQQHGANCGGIGWWDFYTVVGFVGCST